MNSPLIYGINQHSKKQYFKYESGKLYNTNSALKKTIKNHYLIDNSTELTKTIFYSSENFILPEYIT